MTFLLNFNVYSISSDCPAALSLADSLGMVASSRGKYTSLSSGDSEIKDFD